ncbi:MAG: hypothetical protein K2X99_12500, partial [Gemmatimonadaceae bacterium]|nr:hypothetical protein [Gemmatimonadaceae bacterium]
MALIEVEFKGNRREFFEWRGEEPAPRTRTPVIVEVERGEDIARVHSVGELAERRRAGTTHGRAQRDHLKAILRVADASEVARASRLREEEEGARQVAVEKVRTQKLAMKVTDAEWQFDRRRITFYFTAEDRVDFRGLVRELEGLYRTRVQMWHIGPREEAKRLDGVGRCGRELCSASWLPDLVPIKTSLAKDQRLATITPTQISGACGRLMCCLRYEHEFYLAARKRFPKLGKIVRTSVGEERVDHTDIFRDTVTLRSPGGDSRVLPLAEFRRETGVPEGAALTLSARDLEDDREDVATAREELPLATLTRAPAAVARPSVTPDAAEDHDVSDDDGA